MKESDFSVSLAVLRVIRGWSQEELSRHSGVRPSSISDYERGKMVPGAGTLHRLLDAMGFPFSALDGTQALIANLQGETSTCNAALPQAAVPGSSATSRHWEIEQAAVEAGKVAARLSRLYFALLEPRLMAPVRATEAPAAGLQRKE